MREEPLSELLDNVLAAYKAGDNQGEFGTVKQVSVHLLRELRKAIEAPPEINHQDAAADMLAAWDEWFSGRGGDKGKADRLARASCFAAEALRQDDDEDTAPLALMRAFLQAMIDPLHEDLDYLRADPSAGPVMREKREARA